MRYISIIIITLFILISSGCVSKDSPDINELTELINKNESIYINNSSIITSKNKYIEYSYFYNNNILFKAYADNDGSIICCSVTASEENDTIVSELFESICINLCGIDKKSATEIKDKTEQIQDLQINFWNFKKIKTPISVCYLIYNNKFTLE